ncbi:MAG: GNAT family N-acetyltransferase [Anaerolineales bacterium]|nr:GNAT family N-acetyltransferase [Anaerolineales bacterium]
MINLNLKVRHAVIEDHNQIANLIFYEANTHRHLDWRSALEWIGSQNYWVLEDNGRIVAALACPEDPRQIAWIRLFSYHQNLSSFETWSVLWETARNEILRADPKVQVTAIVTKQWFQNILISSGFELRQDIVLLQLDVKNAPHLALPQGVKIRSMQAADLPVITKLDLAAFGEFWHNTYESIERAHAQALYATVAEDASGLVGYQISTGNPFGAHLARLGVRPEAQGRGIGRSLVDDLNQYLIENRIGKLSVNTQSDNDASLSLYQKIGFVRTGEYFPVLVCPTGMS